MEQVNIKELKNRLSFWLNNLPVEVTNHGRAVARLIPVENVATTFGDCSHNEVATPAKSNQDTILTADAKAETIAKLREKVSSITGKVDTSTGEIVQPEKEQRIYTEYNEEHGEDIIITGTFQDFIRQCKGKQRASAAWKQGKPVHA